MDPIGESPTYLTGLWAHGEVGTNLLGFGCDHSGVLLSTAWVSWNISVAAGCWEDLLAHAMICGSQIYVYIFTYDI